MVIVSQEISPLPKRKIQDKTVADAYDYIESGFPVILNDGPEEIYPKAIPITYVEKVGGITQIDTVSGATGSCKGRFVYIDPSSLNSNRSHLIFAFNDIIYCRRGGTIVKLRDAGDDGFTISHLQGRQYKNNAFFSIGDTSMSAELYKYSGEVSGSISAFADYGGTVTGTVKVTDTAHGLASGNTVTIAATTNYNGSYEITVIDDNNFYITATWVSDDGTGTWTALTITKETETNMPAANLIGLGDDRIVTSGLGENSGTGRYSVLDTTGDFSDFTVGTGESGGGTLSGSMRQITRFDFVSPYIVAFEKDKVNFHEVRNRDDAYDGSIIKNSITTVDSLTVGGLGTKSKEGSIVGKSGNIYFADEENKTIYEYIVGRRPKLNDLGKLSTPTTFENYDFSEAELAIDNRHDLLYVVCSSRQGGTLDTTFIYSFQFEKWSVDPIKTFKSMVWDDVEKKMYGFHINDPTIYEVFDSTYSNLGQKIKLKVRSRSYDAGDDYAIKEYEESSIKIGAYDETQSFVFKYFIDEQVGYDISETKTLEGLGEGGEVFAAGAFGAYGWASGSMNKEEIYFFKRYLNEDAVSDFSRLTVSVEEESFAPAFIGVPRIIYLPTDDSSDDFL